MNHVRHALLIAILLCGQGALLAHQADLPAHAAGETCEVCLQASPLDSLAALAIATPRVYTKHSSYPAPLFAARRWQYSGATLARAPPHAPR